MTWVVLDALRRKRNVNDYQGDPIEPEAVVECTRQASALRVLRAAGLPNDIPTC